MIMVMRHASSISNNLQYMQEAKGMKNDSIKKIIDILYQL